MARNLNRIIDINYYPVESARRSNMRHRPIGIGVQVGPSTAWLRYGMADACLMKLLLLLHTGAGHEVPRVCSLPGSSGWLTSKP